MLEIPFTINDNWENLNHQISAEFLFTNHHRSASMLSTLHQV